jgi:hypothetical protein
MGPLLFVAAQGLGASTDPAPLDAPYACSAKYAFCAG